VSNDPLIWSAVAALVLAVIAVRALRGRRRKAPAPARSRPLFIAGARSNVRIRGLVSKGYDAPVVGPASNVKIIGWTIAKDEPPEPWDGSERRQAR